MRNLILFCLFCGLTITAHGQQQYQMSTQHKGPFSASGYISIVNIDTNNAQREGIDDIAYAVSAFADYRSSAWLSSIGFDIIYYDDKEEFSQLVRDDRVFYDDDLRLETSEARSAGLSIASGLEWRFGHKDSISASLQGGYTAIFSSQRSIDDCTNCFSEDIDVDGGAFFLTRFSYNIGAFEVGLHHRQYLGEAGLLSMSGLLISGSF